MSASNTNQLKTLAGYIGHAEISSDFELIENSTTHAPEVIAELCGVIIGYLKAQAATSDPVLSISIVHDACVLLTCPTNRGYLLLQLARNGDFSNLRATLSSIAQSS